jgi:hypothetical protein
VALGPTAIVVGLVVFASLGWEKTADGSAPLDVTIGAVVIGAVVIGK